MPFVYLIATLDTKGDEARFVRDRFHELQIEVRVIDASCQRRNASDADISAADLLGSSAHEILASDRGSAVNAMAAAVRSWIQAAFASGSVAGVMGLGGSAGTTIATAAMRALPIGVPKLMVSTLASGQTRPYVGDKDLCLVNSVVDIAGLNPLSRQILAQAASAMAGMIRFPWHDASSRKPLIAATMFGVTTPCVTHARRLLENAGYEVMVFHATGSGGQAMETLIREGYFAGVLDITTTELADELVGGILSAGPTRLTAAAERGVPQVISVGALDMVNFGPRETVPEKFSARQFHGHNSSVTLMRTTPEECDALGAEIGRKAAASVGPVEILLPLQGVSALDRAGQPFHDVVARETLYAAIASSAGNAPVQRVDCHINDEAFATLAATRLLQLIATQQPK